MRKSVILAGALAIGQVFAATASLAGGGVTGPVTIKGDLYVDGVLTKVNCAGSDGNTLDGGAFGERIFTIVQSCPLWEDTGTQDEFRFQGQEEQAVVNDKTKNVLVFSGVETGTGPVLGAASSEQKVKDDGKTLIVTSEKGDMTYSYTFGEGSTVIFIGTFSAKY